MAAFGSKSDPPEASFVIVVTIVTETHCIDYTGEELGKSQQAGDNHDRLSLQKQITSLRTDISLDDKRLGPGEINGSAPVIWRVNHSSIRKFGTDVSGKITDWMLYSRTSRIVKSSWRTG